MSIEAINDFRDNDSFAGVTRRPKSEAQCEAIYFQTLLKSECLEQHFIHESNPLEAKHLGNLQCDMDYSHENKIQLAFDNSVDGVPTPSLVVPKQESNVSIDQFVKSIWPYAQQAASLIGLDPKVLMAQVALETGWGRFIAKDVDGSSSYNLFNIKAHNVDEAVRIKTTEYQGDQAFKTTALFKKYPTVEQSFNDYITLIQENSRYKNALSHVDSPDRYVNALYDAGYATDPSYADKILSIYHGDELRQALERNGFAV